MVTFVGAVGIPVLTGLKGFQGSDGQWKGLSFTAFEAPSGEPDVLEAVVSSSDDSSLAEALDGESSGEAVARRLKITFLSGDQPGGRRLLNN